MATGTKHALRDTSHPEPVVRRDDSARPVRRILLVSPSHVSYPTAFQYSMQLTGASSLMPPLGLLTVAAVLPKSWQVRLVDENVRRATDEDFQWADAVLVSGIHLQLREIRDIARRAHANDRVVALGGPSVSACPEYYPEFDYLHVGEMGDATDELVDRLSRDISRPEQQVVLTTNVRLELTDFPPPAYELVEFDRYMVSAIQFSSGCPYECDFCDIPALYGRIPRLKTPAQVLSELDKLLSCGRPHGVIFVDDNLIANRKGLRELLPHLIEWQKRNGYPFTFSCEATLNIAKRPELLELMRDAFFVTMFCGIETPDPQALKAMAKGHNSVVPVPQAVEIVNSYGIEIVSGIIIGLDTDTPDTSDYIVDFIEQSHIALLAVNLLQAPPRTPLWDRLEREKRLVPRDNRESNVVFRLPYEQVLGMWRDCIGRVNEPASLFARFEYQFRRTYPHRLKPKRDIKVTWKDIRSGLRVLGRIVYRVGIRSDYRGVFWRFAWPWLLRGELGMVAGATILSYHQIRYGRELASGQQNLSTYGNMLRAAVLAPAK